MSEGLEFGKEGEGREGGEERGLADHPSGSYGMGLRVGWPGWG